MSESQVHEYLQLKGEAGELLADLGSSLITLVEGAPDDGEAHRAIDEQLQSFWGKFYSLKKRWNKEQLSVAVLALTKSGEQAAALGVLTHAYMQKCLEVSHDVGLIGTGGWCWKQTWKGEL
jgi:hypothetical protein